MDLTQRFLNGTPGAKGNHTITNDGPAVLYLLHGHAIVKWNPEAGTFEVRHAGYATNTTAKALNALLRACSWLPFELKAWRLKDVRTGRTVPVVSDWLCLVRTSDAGWKFADETVTVQPTYMHALGLAPEIGGAR